MLLKLTVIILHDSNMEQILFLLCSNSTLKISACLIWEILYTIFIGTDKEQLFFGDEKLTEEEIAEYEGRIVNSEIQNGLTRKSDGLRWPNNVLHYTVSPQFCKYNVCTRFWTILKPVKLVKSINNITSIFIGQ